MATSVVEKNCKIKQGKGCGEGKVTQRKPHLGKDLNAAGGGSHGDF